MEAKTILAKLDDCIERLTLSRKEGHNIESQLIAQELREIREEIRLNIHAMQIALDVIKKEVSKKDEQIAFYKRQNDIMTSKNIEDWIVVLLEDKEANKNRKISVFFLVT